MRHPVRKLVKRHVLENEKNAFKVAQLKIRTSHATLKMLQLLNQWNNLSEFLFNMQLKQYTYYSIRRPPFVDIVVYTLQTWQRT